MNIRLGYEMVYSCTQPTPTMLTLNIHSSRVSDLLVPDYVHTDPSAPQSGYRDGFGNWVTRLILPEGVTRVFSETTIIDSGMTDPVAPEVQQHLVEDLPDEVLVYLLGSRYCETDILMEEAWRLFDSAPFGWLRVQAICDFVHQHISFGYGFARPTKTAAEAYREKAGVCRDYTHLAIALCRCMNIPARYCAGYVADIGNPDRPEESDFAAWFEAYLDGGWYLFDPRNNRPLVGRVLIAQGRDAADIPIANVFGPHNLDAFKVFAEEVA